jgi:hypothetical protein
MNILPSRSHCAALAEYHYTTRGDWSDHEKKADLRRLGLPTEALQCEHAERCVVHTQIGHLAQASVDAILGVKELFDTHPEVIKPSLSTLLASCARLIGDEVRLIPLSGYPSHCSLGCQCPQDPPHLLFKSAPKDTQGTSGL